MFLDDFENSQAFNDDWAQNSRNNEAQIKLNMSAQRELQEFDKLRESNGSIGTVKTQNQIILVYWIRAKLHIQNTRQEGITHYSFFMYVNVEP